MSASDVATAERVLRRALVPALNQRHLFPPLLLQADDVQGVLVQYDVLGLGNRLLPEVAPAHTLVQGNGFGPSPRSAPRIANSEWEPPTHMENQAAVAEVRGAVSRVASLGGRWR